MDRVDGLGLRNKKITGEKGQNINDFGRRVSTKVERDILTSYCIIL